MGQGGPVNSSSSVNTAQGRIIVDVSQLAQAQAGVNSFAQNVTVTLNQINNSAGKAQQGVSDLFRAFGIGVGAAGISQLARFALDANATAVAFDRQTIAARNLAGSQSKLNELLAAYDRATGGAIDKAQAMADVTRLQAVGMADNAEQLERLVTAARGAAVAMGRSTQDILGEVQLAIANQSFRRLDQIGLGVTEVKQRMDELKASTAGMTNEAAFQEAVIDQLTKKYGDLAKSAEALPTGIEDARKALKDFRTEFGELTEGVVNFTGEAFSNWLKQTTQDIKTLSDFFGPFLHSFQQLEWMVQGKSIAFQEGLSIRQPSLLPSAANFNAPSGNFVNPNQTEIDANKLAWGKGIADLNQRTNEELLQQNQSYQEQRASSERQYQTSTLRAQQDFALARQREEQDLADTIARMQRDSAERQAREAEDLARSIADAVSASNDRVAKAKSDTVTRLNELDENYEKERLKRAEDLNDSLLDAAGELDAKQVYELQRNAARQEQEAKEAHDDQRDKLQKQLQERLDDEQKSLAKSIQQQKDAYDRRLQDERDADAQRITDMQTDLKKRQEQEDYDHGIQMQRLAQDHNDQLTEMDRQQGLRIQQIKEHASQERTQLDTEHESAMVKLGVQNQEWINAETKLNNDTLKLLEPLLEKGRSLILFPNAPSNTLPLPGMVGSNAPLPYTGNGGTSYNNSRSFSPTVNLTIQGGSSLTQKQIEDAVHKGLMDAFGDIDQ